MSNIRDEYTNTEPPSSLHAKLQTILEAYASIDDNELGEDKFNGHHDIETGIAQILQAFKNDPHWFNRGEIVLTEDATNYIPVESNVISPDSRIAYNQGLMWATEYMMKKQGQEFYDRFNTELNKEYGTLQGNNHQIVSSLQHMLRADKAARRAAGVSDE